MAMNNRLLDKHHSAFPQKICDKLDLCNNTSVLKICLIIYSTSKMFHAKNVSPFKTLTFWPLQMFHRST